MHATSKTLSLAMAGIILAGIGLGWVFFHGRSAVKHIPLTQTGPILFFGDSLVEGTGASSGHDLPALLAQSLGEPVLNYGAAGDTTRQSLKRVEVAVAEQPRLVLLLLGGNDFLQRVPRDETFANLENIIGTFQAAGAAVVLIGVRSGIIGGGADDRYRALAAETQSYYIEDVLQGIFGDPALMGDAIHPNDRGYQKIADRLLPEITALLKQ